MTAAKARSGQHQLTRRGEFAVLVGQRERAEPGFVAGFEVRVAHQRQDGVGEFVGVEARPRPRPPRRRATRRRRPAPEGSSGRRAAWRAARPAFPAAGARRRGGRPSGRAGRGRRRRVGERQQDLARADGGTAARERHRKAGQPVGVDARRACRRAGATTRGRVRRPRSARWRRRAGAARRPTPAVPGGVRDRRAAGWAALRRGRAPCRRPRPRRPRPRTGAARGSSSVGAAGARNATRGSRSRTAARRAPSSAPRPSGPGTRSTVPVVTGAQPPRSSAYASAARCTRKSVSGPGAGWRRAVSSGNEAISSAGTPSGSSVGVGACTTAAVRGRSGAPSSSTGTAQVTVQCGRSRSSTGRSASRSAPSGAVAADGPPAVDGCRRRLSSMCDVRRRARTARSTRVGVRGLDDDLGQARQREEQRVVDAVEQAAHQVLRGAVAQRQHHDGVVALGGGALGGQRQPQQRYVSVAAAQLVAQAGAGLGGLGGQLAGLGERPAHAAGAAHHGGLVADGEHGGEPDAEPADGRLGVGALGARRAGWTATRRRRRPGGRRCWRRRARRGCRGPRGAGSAGAGPWCPARAAASAAFWASSTTRRSR